MAPGLTFFLKNRGAVFEKNHQNHWTSRSHARGGHDIAVFLFNGTASGKLWSVLVLSSMLVVARQHRKGAVAPCMHIDIVAINMSENFIMI